MLVVDSAPARAGFKHWVLWVVLGSLGWAVGFVGAFGLAELVGSVAYGDADFAYGSDFAYAGTLVLAFVLGGIGLGAGQALALRAPLRIDGGWAVGYVAGAVLMAPLVAAIPDSRGLAMVLVPYVVGGFIAGLIQTLQLRGGVRSAWVWFLVQAVAFVLAGALGTLGAQTSYLNQTAALALGMFAAGLFTGLVAVGLSRQRTGRRMERSVNWIQPASQVPSLRGPPPAR